MANKLTSKQMQMQCMHHAGGASQSGKPVTLFGDTVEKLCCHPAYRLLSLRSLPQMPPGSIDFTTFTWPAILRRLRQMQITGCASVAASFAAAAAVVVVAAVSTTTADFCALVCAIQHVFNDIMH